MNDALVLADGRALQLVSEGEIGDGPWARLLAGAIVPDPRSARAQRGRDLAAAGLVHTVSIGVGGVTAKVTGSSGFDYDVELHTRPLSRRVWEAAVASGRDFVAAAAGREQSVRLEHELAAGWGEPLVPPGRAIRRSCTCPDIDFSGTCKHVIAVAFVLAEAIDDDPSLLLRWRGVLATEVEAPAEPAASPPATTASPDDDPWALGAALPEIGPPRPLPVAAVLKRLGASGIKLDGVELVELLEPAYVAFSAENAGR
ncbi:MAG: SWIM zinc finger family protein [Gaiellales bacterium]